MEDTFDRRLDNLLQAIQLHKTILSGQFPSTPENKFNAAKSLLMQTVDHKRHLVTKFSLVCGQTTELAVVGPVCEQLEQASAGLVQAIHNVLMEAVAGPTLSASLVTLGQNILDALIEVIVQGIKGKGNVPVLTSVVWNGLDKLKALPFDNKTAVLKSIQNYSTQVKDAYKELLELQEDAGSSLSVSDEDDFDLRLDAEGKVVLPHCIELVKLACMTITQIYCKAVNEIPLENTSAQRDWLEEMKDLVKAIGSTVDDLSESIYPPQDKLALAVIFDKLKGQLLDGVKLLEKEKFSEALLKLIPMVETKINAVALP